MLGWYTQDFDFSSFVLKTKIKKFLIDKLIEMR